MGTVSKPVRVLQIAGGFRKDENGKALSGGIVACLHNYCPRVDESIIHFDYLALKNQCFEDYRSDFEAKGSQLFCLNIQSDGIKRALAVVKQLKRFLQEHHYDAVHINIGSFFPVLCCAYAAKKAGVKQIITHSHSAGIYSRRKRFFANIFKPLLPHYATDLCACSELAALNLYPEKLVREGKIRIIRNAVDAERFRFDPEQRQQIRAQLGLGSEPVVGHVGRFVEVKNHKFLLAVFRELKKSVPDAKLLLVGDGELLPKMQKTAAEMGIADSVIFAGRQMNVPLYYQAMDIFVLPSTVEGFPISALEAQASGLPSFLSDNITREVQVTKDCHYFDLKEGASKAAESILKHMKSVGERRDTLSEIQKAGFDLTGNLPDFMSFYLHNRESARSAHE